MAISDGFGAGAAGADDGSAAGAAAGVSVAFGSLFRGSSVVEGTIGSPAAICVGGSAPIVLRRTMPEAMPSILVVAPPLEAFAANAWVKASSGCGASASEVLPPSIVAAVLIGLSIAGAAPVET